MVYLVLCAVSVFLRQSCTFINTGSHLSCVLIVYRHLLLVWSFIFRFLRFACGAVLGVVHVDE